MPSSPTAARRLHHVRRDVMPFTTPLPELCPTRRSKVYGASRSGDQKSLAISLESSFSRRPAGRSSKVRALKDTCPTLALRRVHLITPRTLRYFTSNAGFRHPMYSVKPATNSRDGILGIFQCASPSLIPFSFSLG